MTTNRQTQRGSASIEFVWFLLIMVLPLVYVLLAVFETQRSAYAVSNASAAAARAFVAADSAAQAREHAHRAASLALDDHGRADAQLHIECRPRCRVPGSVVTVTVRMTQALPGAPSIFGHAMASVPLEARHSEPFGRHRAAR